MCCFLICGYTPQSGRSFEEKQSLYDVLKDELNIHSTDDLDMCLSDINGHAGRHIDEFDGVHGRCGVCQRNYKGRILLVLLITI